MLTIPRRQHLKINTIKKGTWLQVKRENPVPLGMPWGRAYAAGRLPALGKRVFRGQVPSVAFLRLPRPPPLAPRQPPTMLWHCPGCGEGSCPARGCHRTAPVSELSEVGLGHFLPSQRCFSSCPIFLPSREGRGDAGTSRGQRGRGEELPAQSPAEPARSRTFGFGAARDLCVALRLRRPSCFSKRGQSVQRPSKLLAPVGRQENKVTIRFLIIFQPLPPPHPHPFAIR